MKRFLSLILVLCLCACQTTGPASTDVASDSCLDADAFAMKYESSETLTLKGVAEIDARFFHVEGCENSKLDFDYYTGAGERYSDIIEAARLSEVGKVKADFVGQIMRNMYGAWVFRLFRYENPEPIAPMQTPRIDISEPIVVDFCSVRARISTFRGQPIKVTGSDNYPDVPAIRNSACPDETLPLILGFSDIEPESYRHLQQRYSYSMCPRVEADYIGIAYRSTGTAIFFDILEVENPRLVVACSDDDFDSQRPKRFRIWR